MMWAARTRVRIKPHDFWPGGATGTVRPSPAVADELCGDADSCSRVTQGHVGPLTMVRVVFDALVLDGDGDGPYGESEILSEYLSPIT